MQIALSHCQYYTVFIPSVNKKPGPSSDNFLRKSREQEEEDDAANYEDNTATNEKKNVDMHAAMYVHLTTKPLNVQSANISGWVFFFF